MSRKLPLTKGLYAIVDDADYSWLSVWNWSAISGSHRMYPGIGIGTGKYREKGCNYQSIQMGRVIMQTPADMQVVFLNGNSLDCRRNNMRNVGLNEKGGTPCIRRQRIPKTSRFKGVCLHKGKWLVQLRYKGKTIIQKYFDDEIEAARAYDDKASEIWGELANTNSRMGLL